MRSEIILPGLHPGQKRVIRESSRYNWLMAGRRWRKTSLATERSVTKALEGARVIWGSPTYKQTKIGWDETLKCVKYGRDVVRVRKSENRMYFPNGWIQYVTLDDPDTIRGYTADMVIFDEVSDIEEQAWTSIVRPMLIDTGGSAWFIGTPKGRNWVWRQFEAVKQMLRDENIATNSRIWTIPTLGCSIDEGKLIRNPHPYENPFIDFDEMVEWFLGTSEREFRQEALAEFIEGEGAVFRGIFESCEGVIRQPYSGEFALGIDWGRTNDYTVFTLIDKWRRRVVDFDRFTDVGFELQKNRLMSMIDKWRRKGAAITILAEQNSFGRALIEALANPPYSLAITSFDTNGATKNPLIEELQLDIERQKIRYPHIDALISELEAYEQETLPSGRIQYKAPDGLHDDTVISLALANRESKATLPQNEPFEFIDDSRPKRGLDILSERERQLVQSQIRRERNLLGL